MNFRFVPLLLLSSSFAFAHTPVSMDPPADLGPVKSIQSDKSQGFCAINMQDKVVCWGEAAQPPADLPAVKSLSLHYDHACALDFQNQVHCWGPDYEFDEEYPWHLEVPADAATALQVTAGSDNDCAIKADGSGVCWNDNSETFELPGEFTNSVSLIPYLNGACAIDADHRMRCFDYSDWYKMVPPAMDVAKFQFDDWATGCALGMDGKVMCFGQDNENNETVPADLGPVKDLSVGRGEACVIGLADKIQCWKIWGPGTYPSVGTPISDPVVAVATGYMAGCGVLASDRTVKCWNDYDPDGDKTRARRPRR